MQPTRKNSVLTIPNILSVFRIGLIPIIVWLYVQSYNIYAVCVLILSGVTDVVDGYIARHFDMCSDLGKVLDPIADKLTQAATLCCLISRFHFMIIPFFLLLIKELFLGVMGAFVVTKTKVVKSANWHGKVTTFILYFTMIIHILWIDIPEPISNMTIGACLAFMALSLVLYVARNIKQLQDNR